MRVLLLALLLTVWCVVAFSTPVATGEIMFGVVLAMGVPTVPAMLSSACDSTFDTLSTISRIQSTFQQLDGLYSARDPNSCEDGASSASSGSSTGAGGHGRRRRRARMRKFEQLTWDSPKIKGMTDKEFRLAFGLSREAFGFVLSEIQDRITPSPRNWGGARNAPTLEPALKLAMTLRWLRGGQVRDLTLLFGVSRNCVYTTAWQICHAICATHTLPLAGAVAEARAGNHRRLWSIASGFARFTRGVISFCIGAIDGVQARPPHPLLPFINSPTHPTPPVSASCLPLSLHNPEQITIMKPKKKACRNPNYYYTRKSRFAVNVQAVADAGGRILWLSIRAPGSVHDSAAFALSHLARSIAALGLCGIYYFIGDDAYINSSTMLTPLPGAHGARTPEDNFNYFHALTRQPVHHPVPFRPAVALPFGISSPAVCRWSAHLAFWSADGGFYGAALRCPAATTPAHHTSPHPALKLHPLRCNRATTGELGSCGAHHVHARALAQHLPQLPHPGARRGRGLDGHLPAPRPRRGRVRHVGPPARP